MENILLIGGSGFIGKNLTIKLKKKYKIYNFDISPSGFENVFFKGSVEDVLMLSKAISKVKYKFVFNLINTLSANFEFNLKKIDEDLSVNFTTNIRVLTLMKKLNLNNYIYFSSGGTVYGDYSMKCKEEFEKHPISFYGYIKNISEQFIKMFCPQNGIKYQIFRPSNPYGKYQNLHGNIGFIGIAIRQIIEGKPVVIFGDGEVVRDYIDVVDLVEIVNLLLSSGKVNEIYNVGSGYGFSLNNILKFIGDMIETPFDLEYLEMYGGQVSYNVLDMNKVNGLIDRKNTRDYEESKIKKYIKEVYDFYS